MERTVARRKRGVFTGNREAHATFRHRVWPTVIIGGPLKHVPGQQSVNGLVAAVISYLQTHSRNPALSRAVVGAALGVSESWLSHQLKQHTDRSFREHLTDLRLTDAERLLRHPSLSLKECGLTAGFPTANAFTTAFRRRFGLSPREWRRAQGAGRRAQGAGRRAQGAEKN